MPGETERSPARGSLHQLRVAERYGIHDNEVLPFGSSQYERGSTYFPLAYPELPTEFARLKDADEASVLAFVQRWGLPGYQGLFNRDVPDPTENLNNRAVRSGDPIDWIRSHAGTVQMVLEVLELRRKAQDSGKSEVFMEGLVEVMRPYGGPSALVGYEFMAGAKIEPSFQLLTYGGGRADAITGDIISTVLNPNLRYLSHSVVTGENGNVMRSTTFPCLLPVIYSFLADAAAGDRDYIRCEACGKFFSQTHGRQRYCPNSSFGLESLCALKARQTKLRSKRKEDEE